MNASTTNASQNERIECPCHNFTALSKIVEILDSESEVECLLSWIGGEVDEIAVSQNKLLSCGKRSRCRFRYGTAYAILNAIRDACRPYLDTSSSRIPEQMENTVSKAAGTPISYEAEFPSLSSKTKDTTPSKSHPAASNILVAPKQAGGKQATTSTVNPLVGTKKGKRRIRPQLAAPVAPGNPVWGQRAAPVPQIVSSKGNISSLPTQDPVQSVIKMPPTRKKSPIVIALDTKPKLQDDTKPKLPDNHGQSPPQDSSTKPQGKTTTESPKEHIRPQLAAPVVPVNPVWGQITAPVPQIVSSKGNISNFPTHNPVQSVIKMPPPRKKSPVDIALDTKPKLQDDTKPKLPYNHGQSTPEDYSTKPQGKTTTEPWGQRAAPVPQIVSSKGNISSLPTQDPVQSVIKMPPPRKKSPVVIALDKKPKLQDDTKPKIPDNHGQSTPQDYSTKPQGKTTTEPPKEHLQHLAEIYIALAKNLLISSTALELHLLLRLVTLDSDLSPKIDTDQGSTRVFFGPIFSSTTRCNEFAKIALSKLENILRNLPLSLLDSLVQCQPFRAACPELCDNLSGEIQYRHKHGLVVDTPSQSVTGPHAMLSLPFDEERDSRHNYRTQSEAIMYKNREETRDAFLYQVRSFMSTKGRVLKPEELEKTQDRLQAESRNILSGVLSGNMGWFADFFCDLLLQIGLSPVEETDQELLNIADRDRLQVRGED
jgi:hypothetical protein